nr:hypothetical protein GCM10020185_15470 [Pseudomonas brassicacearum subsp. brassicacearum]
MKIDPRISAELARLEPNQIGVMAWSLLAHPVEAAGGIPGQPDPDTPPTNNLPNPASLPCRTSRLLRLLPDETMARQR